MLTSKDFDKLIQIFPTKDEVRLIVRQELEPMQDTLKRVLGALDRLATSFEKLNIEYAAMSQQLSRHERWIQHLAKQSKVKLAD